jgi:lysophospholipase L1-like esterase
MVSKSALRGAVRVFAASVYLLIVAACAAATLEYVARVRNSFGYIRSDSPREIYELRPDRADHNGFGQRDRTYSRTKAPGTFRVAGVGDSYTYGMGTPRERVFLKEAERVLGRRTSQPVEVINFGVPGYNTAQEANLLEDRIPAWDPDLVVLQFCRNDFSLPNFIQTSASSIVTHSFALHVVLTHPPPGWRQFVKREIMGYRYGQGFFPVPGLEHVPMEDVTDELDGVAHTSREFIRDLSKAPPEYRYMLGVDGVRAALRRVGEWSRAGGVPVIFLVGWRSHDRDAAEWGAAEGLEVLDIWPAVTKYLEETGHQFTDLWVAPPSDNHPNEKGHAVIGQALAEAIAPHLAASDLQPSNR